MSAGGGELGRLIRAHLRALEAKGYAASTVRNRTGNLRQFRRWAEARGLAHPREVTLPVLERYRGHLHGLRKPDGRPLGWGTQAQKLVALKGFLAWAARLRHIPHDPAAALELPRRPKRIPRAVLTREEAEAVLRGPDLSTPVGLRDRAILEVLYSSGLRRSEVSGLALTDVDAARGTLLVREGKGRRDRTVPVGERALAWLETYLRTARPALVAGADPGALFLTPRGRPLRPKALGRLAHAYLEAADVGKTGACHIWRHTMATLMLEGGATTRDVQEMLGHEDIRTTEIYTHVSVRRLKAIHRRTHPAARLGRGAEDERGGEP